MANRIFSQIAAKRPPRNTFDLSHEVKLSCNMGELIPFLCQEVLPGDVMKINTQSMIRFAPMVSPVMHRIDARFYYFFVPNRLIWDDWETFATGGETGEDAPVFPYKDTLNVTSGSLADYLGLPNGTFTAASGVTFSALPFRAYSLIWNEYFRDQNLQDPIDFPKTSGKDTFTYLLRKKCWEKDYFTSALPFAQRGADVTFPLGEEAVVKAYQRSGTGAFIRPNNETSPWTPAADPAGIYITSHVQPQGSGNILLDGTDNYSAVLDPNGTLYADLKDATATTINELRRMVKLQEFLERSARGGSRYVEHIYAHWGVRADDYRLQRPQFLGGGKVPCVIGEVPQTSQTTDGETGSPQGTLAGKGLAVGESAGATMYAKEDGFLIGLMVVLPKTAYQQGVPRMFSRRDRFDYAYPEFAHLGEQEVLNKELYVSTSGEDNDGVFGYQSRYAEYKYVPNTVHGAFRDTLNFWHMGRIFENAPQLNASFVQADPTSRIWAVTDAETEHLYVQLYNDFKASRLLPKFGTPSL